jgi:hypothetical protein
LHETIQQGVDGRDKPGHDEKKDGKKAAARHISSCIAAPLDSRRSRTSLIEWFRTLSADFFARAACT